MNKRRKLAVIAVAVGLLAAACSSIGSVAPNDSGEVVFTLTDNNISPAVVKVKPGQTVRFVIKNEGAHTHEFMIGRDPIRGENYLTERVWSPWGGQDFFEGLDVMVSGDGMAMGFAGMDGMDGMDMEGDAGGDMTTTTMNMTSTTMAMTDTTMDMSATGEAEGDGDEGGMVLLEPGTPGSSEAGQISIMEFVVPDDATGTWIIGCFQEAGQHYEDGMRATLIVEA